jgi:hypothetical protein
MGGEGSRERAAGLSAPGAIQTLIHTRASTADGQFAHRGRDFGRERNNPLTHGSPTMTSAQPTSASHSFGFAAQMRDADFSQFRNWYDRTCLLPVAGRPATDGEQIAAPTEKRQRLAA